MFLQADLSAAKSSPPTAKKVTPPSSNSPALTKKSKKEEAAKDKEVLRKVQELQARKQKLLEKVCCVLFVKFSTIHLYA